MVNQKGIIQNNRGITELLRELKNDRNQYKVLSRKEERDLIDEYVAKGKEDELRILLARYNIRMVFHIAKKYCKATCDFDNMVAKGLYGLVYAANRFDLYKQVVKKTTEPVMVLDRDDPLYGIDNEKCGKVQGVDPETHKPLFNTVETPLFDENGSPVFVRFCTHAYSWIFKYVLDEFDRKSNIIDSNSISLSNVVRIHNSVDTDQTVENYIGDMLSPDYATPKNTLDYISEHETTDMYDRIRKYVSTTNELTAVEKGVIIGTFYNGRKIKDIANEYHINSQVLINKKLNALKKIRKHLGETYHINNLTDFPLTF